MGTWQLQIAKARLSEVIDTAEKDGPQIITRHGVKTAVVIPFAQWEQSQERKASLLEVLQSGPQFELNIPPRGQVRLRKPVKL